MEPSQPYPIDFVHPPPPIDSPEMDEKIDPVTHIKPSKRLKSSESMNPDHHGSAPSSPLTMEPSQPSPVDSVRPSPPMDVMEMHNKIDPVEQIDPLISFVESQPHKMNNLSEAGSRSSEGWYTTVRDVPKHAATTIDTISEEAERISKSDAKKATGSLTSKVMKGGGQLPFNYLKRRKIGGQLPCNYLKRRKIFRFWSATTAAAQTNQHRRDERDSLSLSVAKDVFLSHSGKQKNFVRGLYKQLTREGVSCFFDEDRKSLPLAEKFPPRIFKAAETCKIAVVVLSKDFVRSKWPMLELSAFIEAKNSGKNGNLILLPIFFKINPNELSNITKDSPEWKKLGESFGTRVEWQNALKEVRRLNGLHFGEHEKNEVKFEVEVVKEIHSLLKEINPPQLLDFEPVGIEVQVEEVKAKLKMESEQSALAVIVCGFGGAGKSTIAASVVQCLDWSSKQFKFCWVVIDQETADKSSHIIKLQRDIIYDLEGVKPDLRNPCDGRVRIKEALRKECCLLFIDNVVDKNYVRELLPEDLSSEQKTESDREKQKTKLRILITCRDEYVKTELKIQCEVHEVRSLSKEDSQRLLQETVLGKGVVEKDLNEESMIKEVAEACRGVPLLLSVFGNHLRIDRNNESYQEALKALTEGNLDSYGDEDLSQKLMFVYDKIKDKEVKEAFLDVCTYFHGWEWNLVANIVDSTTLEGLRRKMLVSKSGSGEVIVHDILRLMGMKVARLTRFVNYKEFADALEDDLDGFVLKDVKGISLVNDNDLITIKSSQLEAMHQSLRVLMLGDWVTLDGPPCEKAFTNLRYLRVGDMTAFPFKDPPKLDKLRVLLNKSKLGMNLSQLPQNLRRISHEVPYVECDKFANLPFRNLSSLKGFIVKPRISVQLPEELHLPASLVDLDLNGCKNLPKDIRHLTALESLILDRSDLECLSQGFGKLKKLKHLSMKGCRLDFNRCKNLPNDISHLTALESFILYRSNLECLPQGTGELKKLKHLSMEDCWNLRALPESLGGLVSLQTLELAGCINLQLLPESLGGLVSLQTLELTGCVNLQLLPESFGVLRIMSLKLHSLAKLHDLPDSFGNMPVLKDFSLHSCHSLMSLPNSFVQLKKLETLKIIDCTKLEVLPQDFGRLLCLNRVTVADCHLFKELPDGFGALPALKFFHLNNCSSFVNLPRDFGDLTSLEKLWLMNLPLISRIPDGFGKLKKLRCLEVWSCGLLKTFSDDFQNMATLELLKIRGCAEFDGAMMEKIVKLQSCYHADIEDSRNLLEKWEQMQGEAEHPFVVYSGHSKKHRDRECATRVALLDGKCVEVNENGQLTERLSLMGELEEGVRATVALIMLPIHFQSHQHLTLQPFVEIARQREEINGSTKLQIVCARGVELDAERRTPTEAEEKAEQEGIREILQSLPKGSCAIPSSQSKRIKVLAFSCGSYVYKPHKLWLVTAKVVDNEGRKRFEKLEFTDHKISSVVKEPRPQIRKRKNEHYENIQMFFYECMEPNMCTTGYGRCDAAEFMEALKRDEIHHLLIHNNPIKVDDLRGKQIGFIICDFKFLEFINLQQFYKNLQQMDSNFIGIWIPMAWPKDYGHGTYTRLLQCMPWAAFPHPQFATLSCNANSKGQDACFFLLDKHRDMKKHNALPMLLACGAKSYPFTHHTIPESFSLKESEPCLKFLLHGMNIVGRKPMTFLYAQRPPKCLEMEDRRPGILNCLQRKRKLQWLKMQSKLEELTQIQGSFEVLYVGKFPYEFGFSYSLEYVEHDYEAATQNMRWPSLSFSDMIMFWYRCKYFSDNKSFFESNIMIRTMHALAYQLCGELVSLVVVDNDGVVTRHGYDVLQMICESSEGDGMAMRMVKDELMKSLSGGQCSPLVKTFFRDEIDDHPLHCQHRLTAYSTISIYLRLGNDVCDVCSKTIWDNGYRLYRCQECHNWDMCGSCWREYAKQKVEQLLSKED